VTPAATSIDWASRLDGDLFVLIGSGESPGKLSATGNGRRSSSEVHATQFRSVLPDGTEAYGWLGVAQLPSVTSANGIGESITDLRTLVRRGLAPLDAATRTRLTTFLAETAQSIAKAPSPDLSERLHRIREGLRERLPHEAADAAATRGLFVEQLLRIDERAFFIQGWMHDEESEIVRVTIASPEGSRVELFERLVSYLRPDVAQFFASGWPTSKHGFSCFFELDAPSLRDNGWIVEMENADGMALEVQVPAPTGERETVRAALLDETTRDPVPDEKLMAEHVHPAMSRIQSAVEKNMKIETVLSYGTPPENPTVTIVVPLYQQIDHVEAQLAEFVHDPEMSEVDLIYVLDSPEDGSRLQHVASYLSQIYPVPFRIALLAQNLGFTGANNAGASLARGRLLLLLNSDVLPDRPGWLSTMSDFYDSKPDIGALGVKLLYEDETIQHAGMYFYMPPNSTMWMDAHYFKGFHRTFPAANIARMVLGISGACMMISRDLYEELGGLSGKYVRGDYEDFDICMQLIDRGRTNWYLPDAELYHLEGQSYSPSVRVPANTYNVWLHTHLWGKRIEELMGGPGPASD
jgi:GT2 family glycosyltransferase